MLTNPRHRRVAAQLLAALGAAFISTGAAMVISMVVRHFTSSVPYSVLAYWLAEFGIGLPLYCVMWWRMGASESRGVVL